VICGRTASPTASANPGKGYSSSRSQGAEIVIHRVVLLADEGPTGLQPAGRHGAELEVKAADNVEPATSGANAANEFRRELAELLKRLPPAPVLPDAAFSRDQIYDE